MKKICWAGALFLSLTSQVSLADMRDQISIQTGKAELVIPGLSPQEAANQIKDALTQFAIPAHLNYRTLPSVTPARPDEPVSKQVFILGAPAIEYHCKTAYAEITKRPPPVKNAFYFVIENLQACLYSFQKGVKVYLIFTVGKKSESLTSGLFDGISKAIRGSDGERITGQLNENISAIRKNIPNLLVEKLEAPGMPVQEPDKAAVASLIPAKTETVAPPLSAMPAGSPPQPVVNAQQVKIEARKNLSAMGLVYHSQEQFVAAIRRKDDVAVQLFLDGEGIDPVAKEKNGKSPLEIAEEAGAADIARIITNKINKPAEKTPAAVPAPQNPLTTGSPQPLPAADDPQALAAMAASLPPETLAEINETIAKLNITEAQKAMMRANAIRQLVQIKNFSERIDPETGQLR